MSAGCRTRHARGRRGIRGDRGGASHFDSFTGGRSTVLPCVWSIEVIALKNRKAGPSLTIGVRMATACRTGLVSGKRHEPEGASEE